MQPATQPLRIALIGGGAMGGLHARVVTQSQDAELAFVVDPNRATGEALADQWRSTWTPDLDDFRGIDAVIIATPTSTHVDWATRVLNEGIPLLVEKPLSEKLHETTAMVDTARRRDVPLMCGFLERYNPAVLTALQIVEEPIHITSLRHSPYAPRITTGVAFDLLIHDVDLVVRLAGRLPDAVQSHFAYAHPDSQGGAEDVAEVTMAYHGGILASLSASRVSQRKVRTLVLNELDRLVEIDLVRQDLTVYRHVGNAPLHDDGPGYRQQTIIDIPTIQQPREPLASQLDRFIGVATGKIDAEEELRTLLPPHQVVAQAVEAAVSSGQNAPIRLPVS